MNAPRSYGRMPRLGSSRLLSARAVGDGRRVYKDIL